MVEVWSWVESGLVAVWLWIVAHWLLLVLGWCGTSIVVLWVWAWLRTSGRWGGPSAGVEPEELAVADEAALERAQRRERLVRW